MAKKVECICVVCNIPFMTRKGSKARMHPGKCHTIYMASLRGTDEERFMKFVQKTEYCWTWTGGKSNRGYGSFSVKWKDIGAHRFSYIMKYGPIAGGLVIHHKCDNRSCVNPDHLFAGTPMYNYLDAVKKGRIISNGEGSPNSKLKKLEVLEIRELYGRGSSSLMDLAIKFHVTTSTIWQIVKRKSWTHI